MNEESVFPYQYSEELEREIWDNCVFVLDTSALLEFYFYSPASQKKLFTNVFAPLSHRLWIPSHVEFEYLKNRKSSIAKPIGEKYRAIKPQYIDEIGVGINSLKSKLVDLSQKTKKQHTHPFLDQDIFSQISLKFDELQEVFSSFAEAATKEIQSRVSEINSLERNDVVLDNIKKIISVGRAYTFSEKMQLLEEAEFRFRNKIPPGYRDAEGRGEKDGLQRIGDLIIWRQIMQYAAEVKRPIVLVTNDVKEDWCYTSRRGNEIRIDRPREELIQEISERAGVRFWMYNFPQFLYACEKISGSSIDSEVIAEVEGAARDRLIREEKCLRFDGYYVSPADSGDYSYYLRFFSSGVVVASSIMGEIDSGTFEWFNESHDIKGTYVLDGRGISFTLVSENGKIDHSGVAASELLVLNTYSHITEYKRSDVVYRFVPFVKN